MEISMEEVMNIFINGNTFFDEEEIEMTEEEFKAQFDLENCPCCRRDYLDHLATL